MNTAEKRAELEAEGTPWPDCECHGQACYWQTDPRSTGGGFFKCAVRVRASHNRSRAKRLEGAGCVHCGDELATDTLCARHADGHADFMADPYQRLRNRAVKARYRQRVRAGEGFHPTGVGIAAFAAYVSNRGDTTGTLPREG